MFFGLLYSIQIVLLYNSETIPSRDGGDCSPFAPSMRFSALSLAPHQHPCHMNALWALRPCKASGRSFYKASVPYPLCASSPPSTKKAGLCLFVITKVWRGVSKCGRLGRCIVQRLCSTAIVHPCTTRKLRVLPPAAPKNSTPLASGVLFLVPMAGVEPARYCYQRILSPSRLPIPSHRLIIMCCKTALYNGNNDFTV